MSFSVALIRKIAQETRGSVLPLGVAGLFVTAAMVGGGVDMSRAYRVENRLQAACDAGVLAGRRLVTQDGFTDAAETEAENYFNANFDEDQQEASETTFVATSPDEGNSVFGVASTQVDTTIMRIFGVNTLDLSAECSATMGLGNADVMMVLDTTGSMAWNAAGQTSNNWSAGDTSRLTDLQNAMKNFYDTVATSAEGSNSRIRYGFVPFSSSVNVGGLLMDLDDDYLVDSMAIQSRRWVKWGAATNVDTSPTYGSTTEDNNWTRTGSGYNTSALCTPHIPATGSWANNGSADTDTLSSGVNDSGNKVTVTEYDQDEIRQYIYSCIKRNSDNKWYVNRKSQYRTKSWTRTATQTPTYLTAANQAYDQLVYSQVTYDVSSYKTGSSVNILTGRTNGGAPLMISSTWGGCIEERQTVPESDFTFVAGTGITPSEALDLDIDGVPDTSDDATKWAPMWPQAAYYRTAGTVFSTSGNSAAGACPYQAQLFEEMDEAGFDEYADSLIATGNTYHDIGMIWGARLSSPQGMWSSVVNDEADNGGTVSRHLIYMTDGELNPGLTVQSSYGIERHDLRITTDGDGTTQYDNHRARFLALCAAVKAKGIRLWVIAFGTGLTTDLQTCASENSSFGADDATELNDAFQEIARNVGELRVTQ